MPAHPRRPAAGLVAALVLALAAGTAAGQSSDGLYVTVPNPLTSEAFTRIKNRVQKAREQADRRPRVVVFDFNPQDKDAATADFGPCYDLAEYVAGLHDVTTVAYVHARVTGHTVLPVLMCQDIVVGPQGALGQVVGPGEPALTGFRAKGYAELVGQRRPAYVAVARKMFDPDVKLRKARKGESDWYVDYRDPASLPKDVVVTDTRPLTSAPDGQTVLLPAAQMEATGLALRTFKDRQDLLDGYGLTAAALKDDPLAGKAQVAYRYAIHGAVDGGTKEGVVRVVEDVVRKGGNVLFLQLECGGGDLQAARDLAGKLTEYQAGDNPILIVAFVPDRAPDTAAVIALGCSEIVMSKRKDATTAGGEPAPEAEFGDFEAALAKGGVNPDFWAASLRELAEKQGYPPLLVEGMVKKDLEVVRAHKKENRSVQRLLTDQEVQADKDRGPDAQWVVVSQVKPKGQLLKLSATQAADLGLVRFTTDTRDPADVFALYGVDPSKVKEATPAWLDRFADFLKQPVVTVLLVVIGFTGLILELKVPGTTVPGIIAALCFILVFWAHTQFSGQVAVLAGLLFILGLVLILLEVFVLPGFGVTGITGIILMLGALGLVTFNEIPQTGAEWAQLGGKMVQYLVAIVAAGFLAVLIARYLPNIPYANRLMLVPPADQPGSEDEPVLPGAAEAAGLLGAVGTAVTVLRPAGSVRFGDRYIDVVTDGGYVPAGARVQVIEVEGTRIVVKEVG